MPAYPSAGNPGLRGVLARDDRSCFPEQLIIIFLNEVRAAAQTYRPLVVWIVIAVINVAYAAGRRRPRGR
jgi:hypothetical protein